MKTAYFSRFSLDLPDEAVVDCSGQGDCTENVNFWASRIERHVTEEDLAAELKEYGAWNKEELCDSEANWRRIIWISACNIKEDCE